MRVGHTTIISGEGKLDRGKGPVRTGVTCVMPHVDVYRNRLIGGTFVLNGAGEVAGLTQIAEWGLIETPILLTNTLSVGKVADAAVKWMSKKHPAMGNDEDVVIPVVGECDDSFLNDAVGRHIRTEHVYRAIETATSGPVAEGSVGAGTGMITCDFKAGIGTSSRTIAADIGVYTLGALVLTNFGLMPNLRIDGVPVGQLLVPEYDSLNKRISNYGSIIVIIGTDAPLVVVAADALVQAGGARHRPLRQLRRARLGRDHPRLLDRQQSAARVRRHDAQDRNLARSRDRSVV